MDQRGPFVGEYQELVEKMFVKMAQNALKLAHWLTHEFAAESMDLQLCEIDQQALNADISVFERLQLETIESNKTMETEPIVK